MQGHSFSFGSLEQHCSPPIVTVSNVTVVEKWISTAVYEFTCKIAGIRVRKRYLSQTNYFLKIIITFRERERGREIGKAFIQRVFSFLLSLSEPFWLMMLSPQSHRLKKILWGNVKFVCSYCRSVVRLVDVSGVYRATVGFIYDAELLLIHFEIAVSFMHSEDVFVHFLETLV